MQKRLALISKAVIEFTRWFYRGEAVKAQFRPNLNQDTAQQTLMVDERRSDERIVTNLQTKWSGLSGRHEALIADLSLGGCYVNTNGRVDLGEVIVVEIKLPSGEWLQLRGEVTSYQTGIGFGILFSFLTDEEEQTLRELIA